MNRYLLRLYGAVAWIVHPGQEKKKLPGDDRLDALLSKKHTSAKGKGIGMKGTGFEFEGAWMGDDWTAQSTNIRREMIGSGPEHMGKCDDFAPTDPYDMGQVGGSAAASWVHSMKRSLSTIVIPALIHYDGLDDVDGRRKIGKGAGWEMHYDSYAKTLKASGMGAVANEKFCRKVSDVVTDYVNAERRRHRAPTMDRQQRHRLAKALMAYVHSKESTVSTDRSFWDEVLPYVMTGTLVSWGHLKTGGAY